MLISLGRRAGEWVAPPQENSGHCQRFSTHPGGDTDASANSAKRGCHLSAAEATNFRAESDAVVAAVALTSECHSIADDQRQVIRDWV